MAISNLNYPENFYPRYFNPEFNRLKGFLNEAWYRLDEDLEEKERRLQWGDSVGLFERFEKYIEGSKTRVLKAERAQALFLDHPILERFSYLKSVAAHYQAAGRDYDYPLLEFIFKRVLYTYLAFGLKLGESPATEEEILEFEREYFTEARGVPVIANHDGDILVFACLVEPVIFESQGGEKRKLLQRCWSIQLPEDEPNKE